ncbi:MAG: putative transport system permease protein [Actinomycetota bacterium]|nr:putative transport system permease protein [Actinomycetota bacterium]
MTVGWRPALRIGRRDAWRAKGRSLLVVIMIALPVLGMTGIDILYRSAQLDPAERVARELGSTRAQLILTPSAHVTQSPDISASGWMSSGRSSGLLLSAGQKAVFEAAGYRLLTSVTGPVVTETRAGQDEVNAAEVDVADRAFRGMYDVVTGRAARRADEVAVSPQLLDRLGKQVGDRVHLVKPNRSVRIVGVVRQIGQPNAQTYYAPVGSGLAGEESTPEAMTRTGGIRSLYLAGGPPVTWHQVLALNQHGLVVNSRDVLLHPPARSEVPYYAMTGEGNNTVRHLLVVIAVIVVVGLAGLEVVLLAGAAFAVGARRQARMLALVAAAGGERHQVRRVVLAGGVVLGAVGAVVGVVLGMVAARLAMRPLSTYGQADFGHFDLRPLEVAGIAVVGLTTGVLAAILPARSAARQDPVVALSGRRGQVRTPKRVPAAGVVIVLVGIGLAALGSARALHTTTGLGGSTPPVVVALLIVGGAALAQIGLIVCAGALVGLTARLARFLPVAPRLALRDAARHRSRSAPAVAAVLAAVSGSVALTLYVASLDAADRAQYVATLPPHTGAVALLQDLPSLDPNVSRARLLPAGQVSAAVTGALHPSGAVAVRTTGVCAELVDGPCTDAVIQVPKADRCPSQDATIVTAALQRAEVTDPRCGRTSLNALMGLPVLSADQLVALGIPVSDHARRVLAEGGVVALSPFAIDHGQGQVRTTSYAARKSHHHGYGRPGGRSVVHTLPAVLVRTSDPMTTMVIGPVGAQRLGLDTRPTDLLLHFGSLPSQDDEDAARAALSHAGLDVPDLYVERGYQSGYGLGLLALVAGAAVITLGATGIATGLAQADARADHATLGAVGGAPRVRRLLAATQSLLIAGLGAVLGIACGFVPAAAYIHAVPGLELTIPWVTLVEVLVGVPLLAALGAWLCTRSRLPLDRRVT